jgi:hypothetical protein
MKFELRGQTNEPTLKVYAHTFLNGDGARFCANNKINTGSYIICEIDSEGFVSLNEEGILSLGLKVRE